MPSSVATLTKATIVLFYLIFCFFFLSAARFSNIAQGKLDQFVIDLTDISLKDIPKPGEVGKLVPPLTFNIDLPSKFGRWTMDRGRCVAIRKSRCPGSTTI